MRWPWRHQQPDVAEAQQHLDRLRRQQPEVNRLSRELREAREAKGDHFSDMVMQAIRGRRAAGDR